MRGTELALHGGRKSRLDRGVSIDLPKVGLPLPRYGFRVLQDLVGDSASFKQLIMVFFRKRDVCSRRVQLHRPSSRLVKIPCPERLEVAIVQRVQRFTGDGEFFCEAL